MEQSKKEKLLILSRVCRRTSSSQIDRFSQHPALAFRRVEKLKDALLKPVAQRHTDSTLCTLLAKKSNQCLREIAWLPMVPVGEKVSIGICRK